MAKVEEIFGKDAGIVWKALSKGEILKLSDLARANDFPVIIDSAYGNPFPGIV